MGYLETQNVSYAIELFRLMGKIGCAMLLFLGI